jgi:hypothetical protein
MGSVSVSFGMDPAIGGTLKTDSSGFQSPTAKGLI